MSKRILAAVLVALIVPLAAQRPAEAGPPQSATQCVAHVVGQSPTGQLELGATRCYATQAQAMSAEDVGLWGPGASERAAVTAPTFVLAIHCDGYNLGGPCLNIVGTGCTSGYVNLDATWNNRISSTQNGCPTIRHYNGFNLTGTVKTTTGVGVVHNLTTFNNLASSIQYL